MSEGRLVVHHGDVLQFDWRSCDNHVQVKQWEEGIDEWKKRWIWMDYWMMNR